VLIKFFSELVTLFSKYEFPWEKMVGFGSDGANAMIDKSNGVAAKLKKKRIRGNDIFLLSPLYSSSRSIVCKKFEDDSRNGHCC
jgi:hypothetical protein